MQKSLDCSVQDYILIKIIYLLSTQQHFLQNHKVTTQQRQKETLCLSITNTVIAVATVISFLPKLIPCPNHRVTSHLPLPYRQNLSFQQPDHNLIMNLKCLLYARYSSSIPINIITKDTSNKELKADLDRMPSKIKALKSKSGERDKLRTPYGVWFVTHDQNDICYALCAADTYPERHAFAMIQKLRQKIGEISHAEYETQDNIKSHTKKVANELMDKYSDLSKVDKVAKVQQEVQSLKDEIGSGIKKIMGNQESLNTMNDKAQKMKNFAGQFQKNAQTLERMLYWRNCKIKVIVALCIIGLLGFIILIIVQRTKSNN